jgi:polyphosphate kinase
VIETDTDRGPEQADRTTAELTRHAWLDRDLSWLEFNRRVLSEALDERNPLLERVKFLAIFSSNLDEFFMKRMAVIRPMAEATSVAAEERRDLIARRRETITSMLAQQATCYVEVILPKLAEHGIHLWTGATLQLHSATSFRTSSTKRSHLS